MKTIPLFLTLVSVGALLGGVAQAEPSAQGSDSSSTAGLAKPESDKEDARSGHRSPSHANPQNSGNPRTGEVSQASALAVALSLQTHDALKQKMKVQTERALIAKKKSDVLNTGKGKLPQKSAVGVPPHNPAKPWGLAKSVGDVTPHNPAVPWGLPKTDSPHDDVITVSKEPKPELKTIKVESLPTEPIGLPAGSGLAARTSNIDRQHAPGLVALGGPKYPSLARNTQAINGSGMKHKP